MKLNTNAGTLAQRVEAREIAEMALSTIRQAAEHDWLADGGTLQEYRRDVAWYDVPTTVTLIVATHSRKIVAAIVYGLAPAHSILYDARVYVVMDHRKTLIHCDTFIAYSREDYPDMRTAMAAHIHEKVYTVTIRLASTSNNPPDNMQLTLSA